LIDYLHKRANKNTLQSKRLKYLTYSEIDHEIHFTALNGDKIVGVAGIQRAPNLQPLVFWIKHISIDEKYRGQGIAEKLLDSVFDYADKHNVGLHRSSYSTMGKERLVKIFNRLTQKYPNVKFTEPTEEYVFEDRIVQSGFKLPDGDVVPSGPFHDLNVLDLDLLSKKGFTLDDAVHGFITDTGQFLNRKEAAILVKMKQPKKQGDDLHTYNIRGMGSKKQRKQYKDAEQVSGRLQ
ncbi:MAG: GNAT family N-acetyltransferase, partial [Richelia sp. RM2_1_2]|nr:GNAT family N-acetyltransferase [Richelia sp. RM2_1_2]